jgi:hypothetical protein
MRTRSQPAAHAQTDIQIHGWEPALARRRGPGWRRQGQSTPLPHSVARAPVMRHCASWSSCSAATGLTALSIACSSPGLRGGTTGRLGNGRNHCPRRRQCPRSLLYGRVGSWEKPLPQERPLPIDRGPRSSRTKAIAVVTGRQSRRRMERGNQAFGPAVGPHAPNRRPFARAPRPSRGGRGSLTDDGDVAASLCERSRRSSNRGPSCLMR